MNFGRWVLGAVVGGFGLGAVGAQSAPVPVPASDGPALVKQAQFFYEDDAPPPPRYYRPPPRYYGPPPHHYGRPPYGPPRYGVYGKEAAKDYVKDYRKMQKDITKEQVRSWNRQNGF